MAITASELRQNIYKLLDQVLETGVPLEIERNGRCLRVTPTDAPPKLDRVVGHEDYIVGDPAALVHIDWSSEWRP
jgi:antitoxin (DNA-binding transcriptional repressor) of toxin-antitoxin stability system